MATAILQLVEEGKLRKSDTLSTWYPDFPNAGEITVDDLLRMRSGIPHYWNEETLKHYYDNPQQNVTNEDIIEATAAKADLFKPLDQEMEYSDTNYNILGAILAKVSGNDIATSSIRASSPTGVGTSTRPTTSCPATCTATAWTQRAENSKTRPSSTPHHRTGRGAMISGHVGPGVWSKSPSTRTCQPLRRNKRGWRYNAGKVRSLRGMAEGIAKLGKLWGHGGTIAGFSTTCGTCRRRTQPSLSASTAVTRRMLTAQNYVLLPVLKSLFPETARTCDRPHPSG